MPAVQSNPAVRTSLVLLFVLLACWESFAFASLPYAGAALTSNGNGILVGGIPSAGTHGSRLHLRAPGAFSKVFRVGRGGDSGRDDFGAEAAGRVADHVVSAASATSSSAVSDTMLSMTGGGGDNAAGDVEAARPKKVSSKAASDSKLGPKAPPPGPLRRALPWYPWHRLPDHLTYLRCVAIPLLVVLYYLPSIPNGSVINSLIFAGASITDYLDGYLARRWDITSAFGAFLDPVADKLMVAIVLVMLVQAQSSWFEDVIAMIIIGREITISALREWMATIGERANVKVDITGKIKTTLQMFGIAFMVYQQDLFGLNLYVIGYYLLLVAAVMTLYSMIIYLRAAWPSMAEHV